MKGLIRNIARDQRGAALVVTVLLLMLLLSAAVWQLDLGTAITHTELDLQEAVEQAVRSATNQVTDESQAKGSPRIHTEDAHAAFRLFLAERLALDPTQMSPRQGSPVAGRASYILIVYNGDDFGVHGGAQPAYQYEFDSDNFTSYPLSDLGMPKQFAITEDGIAYGAGGTFDVTLDTPGCIALVKASLRSPAGGTVDVTRWASAVIKMPG